MATVEVTASIAELKRRFAEFLQPEVRSGALCSTVFAFNGDGRASVQNPDSKYMAKIRAMMDNLQQRLIVSITDLRDFDRTLARTLMNAPSELLPLFEGSVKEIVLNEDGRYFERVAESRLAFMPANDDGRSRRILIGFEGNFGELQVNPRTLTSEHLGHLVAVEGIVTRVSLVHPKPVRSVHFCAATGAFETREYRDAYDATGGVLPTGTAWPSRDNQGNPYETEFGLSAFKDTQTVTIQEMPESSPLGQLPRAVDVYCEEDLVDAVKPGDRVCVVGVYRALSMSNGNVMTGAFRTSLVCNAMHRISREVGAVKLTGEDVKNITAISKRKDCFDLVARSLAPSIYGHKYIKQALTLLLLGGREHNLANGTHIRGDINILMVGDPSTAKSQLLRFVLNIAPLAVNTTGRGSTGVGLTAAVTSDPETGERRLEAGAMVLADRGIVTIDEFDKMSDADRVAIHEVMEQQTVTIAKAGIQASLNARCSVVAAANPIYGRFDNSLPLARNVALPDSLISRFDLVFIVRDRIDEGIDSRLASHVLRMHRYVRPGHEGIPIPLDATALTEGVDEDRAEEDEGTTPVFQKYNPLLHGGAASEGTNSAGKVEILTMEFIRKFISYVRHRTQPKLTDAARGAIVEFYNDFRQRNRDRATVITARSLETLIRLSTAHAKLRLAQIVDRQDVDVAHGIMHFALYADAKFRQEDANERLAGAKAAKQAATVSATAEPPASLPPAASPTRAGKRARSASPQRDVLATALESSMTAVNEDADEASEGSASKRARDVSGELQESVTADVDDSQVADALPAMADEEVDDSASAGAPVQQGSPEYKAVMRVLHMYRERTRSDSATLPQITGWLRTNAALVAAGAEPAVVEALTTMHAARWRLYLADLEAQNRLMLVDGIVHFI